MIKKYTYSLCFTLLIFFQLSSFAQQSSFQKSGTKQESNRQLIVEKIDSAKAVFKTQPLLAYDLVEEAVTLAIKGGFQFELANAYSTLGYFNMANKDYRNAILQNEKALTIYLKLDQSTKIYDTQMALGEANLMLNNFETAKLNYTNAALNAKKAKRTEAYLKARLEVGNISILLQNLTEAEQIFLDIKTQAKQNKLINLEAEADLKLGEIYEKKGERGRALDLYGNANSNAVQTKNSDLLNRSNERQVSSLEDGNASEYAQVIDNLNETRAILANSNDTVGMLENSIQFADYYTKQGNLEDAAKELKTSALLSQQTGDLAKQIEVSKTMYDLYTASGNHREAKKILTVYQSLVQKAARNKASQQKQMQNEQIALKSVEKQINVLERERKLDHQTIQLLEKEKALNLSSLQQQRYLLYTISVILLISIGLSIYVYRNNRAKKRANQLLYLKSLRAQMNPHFIFNSLNSVNNFIAQSDERAANKYISKFAKLMRKVLEYSQVEFISLSKEIEVLELYVGLEHERFNDKFNYTFHIDKSIKTDDYTIPPMLIQPFIENAIWHGLRYKNELGFLEISFLNKEDHIEISISDNGIGREKSRELKTENQKKYQSTGMQNVENRMEVIRSVFSAKIHHEIVDLPNNSGTKVIIKLFQPNSKYV